MRRAMIVLAALALTGAPAFADGPATTPTIRERLAQQQQAAQRAAGPVQPAGPAQTPPPQQTASTTTTPPTAPAAPVAAPPAQPVAPSTPPPAGGGLREFANGVTLQVPSSWVFYPPTDAQAYLGRIGAAPPPGEVLGMLAPIGRLPEDEAFWGAVLSFNPIGAISEEGAEEVSSMTFLQRVRDARGPEAPRVVEMQPFPRYDAERDVLIWAERTENPPTAPRVVRYAQRLPGREGVVGFDVHVTPERLGEVLANGPSLTGLVSFQPGRRLGDFDPAVDRRSDFDVPGLITGRRGSAAGGGDGAFANLAGQATQAAPWLAMGAVLLVLVAGVGFLISGRGRKRRQLDSNITPP